MRNLWPMLALALAVRWAVALGPHSGEGRPPMHGDFEAQRHWMELTLHLPRSAWYWNGTHNDLQYWGLDYPPLTAYHSLLCGAVGHWLNPEWMALDASHGHESPGLKLFMRATVVAVDLVVWLPAVLLLLRHLQQQQQHQQKHNHSHNHNHSQPALLCVVALLLQPALLLIDHGHFQFNSASLGLALLAFVAFGAQHDLLGSVCFVLALCYKQMCLYYAIPVFTFLLGRALHRASGRPPLLQIALLGAVVAATFALCFLPVAQTLPDLLQVLHRLFPFQRGLFEDKVANFWCSFDVLVKLRRMLALEELTKLSLACTLAAALPSSVRTLFRPSWMGFKLSLFTASMAFFLFSFQVHEKTILLVALPAALLIQHYPLAGTWFQLIAAFSMYPLLLKDGLVAQYIGCQVLFLAAALLASPTLRKSLVADGRPTLPGAAVASALVEPPPRYPDIHAVAISMYSFLHFAGFYAFFSVEQFRPGAAAPASAGAKKKPE